MKERNRTRFQEYVEVKRDLDSRVRAYTPDLIRNSEHTKRIMNNFQHGVVAMSMFMIMDAGENDDEPRDHMFEYCWSFRDLARTVLSGALPGEQIWADFPDTKPQRVPLNIVLADYTNWWNIISDGQKDAFFDIFGLQWSAVRDYIPREEDKDTRHVVYRGEDAWITGEDIEGYVACPTILWNPHHGLCITAVPFPIREEEATETIPKDFIGVLNEV